MSTDVLAGSFPKQPGANFVSIDGGAGAGQGAFTQGRTITTQATVQPSLTEKWTAVGWSMRAKMCIVPPLVGDPTWARFGNLWGGLEVDAPPQPPGFPAQIGPKFPADLSPFAILWNGPNDPLPLLSSANSPESQFGIVALTFMLPVPILIRSGANLQMALVLTSSLVAGNVSVVIRDCEWSLIYDNGH